MGKLEVTLTVKQLIEQLQAVVQEHGEDTPVLIWKYNAWLEENEYVDGGGWGGEVVTATENYGRWYDLVKGTKYLVIDATNG